MKIAIEEQIEVTMVMTLKEARIIKRALALTTNAENPGNDDLHAEMYKALRDYRSKE